MCCVGGGEAGSIERENKIRKIVGAERSLISLKLCTLLRSIGVVNTTSSIQLFCFATLLPDSCSVRATSLANNR